MSAVGLLVAACVCAQQPKTIDWREIDAAIAEAARKTDREVALRRLREELEEILRRNREAFVRGKR